MTRNVSLFRKGVEASLLLARSSRPSQARIGLTQGKIIDYFHALVFTLC